MEKRLPHHAYWIQAVVALCLATSVQAGEKTDIGTATATALSSGWIAFEPDFTGDDDRDGWTVIELGLSVGGPFDLASPRILPGETEWRSDSFRGLTADTDYYLQMTWEDPDGVTGNNPQIIGPVHTLATAPNAVSLGTVSTEVRMTGILVSLPIADDANGNSYGTVEISTQVGGPWTERCGSPTENRLPYHSKRCRLRSLTPGTDYWVRITVIDPDGITGTNPQIIGPINYTGLENVAAGRPITADPGWGCCPNPAQLLDGRIQSRYWSYGFAWTGGNSGYGGGPPGWKQATIDLGAPTAFERLAFWAHGSNSLPTDWKVQSSDDGASWSETFSTTAPMCRGADIQTEVSWSYPSCSQDAQFPTVTARYVRYWFDDRTLFGGLHGWGIELEVFGPDTSAPNAPPGLVSTSHVVGIPSEDQTIDIRWDSSSDAGSGIDGYTFAFSDTADWECDEIKDVESTTMTATSAVLDSGSWYAHVCAIDGAGNWSQVSTAGPFTIELPDGMFSDGFESVENTGGITRDSRMTIR